MKKILMTLALNVFIFILVGCGNINVPNDDKVMNDMNESEIVDVYIEKELRQLKVDSIEVKKATTDDNIYTVYCTAKQSDEEYEYLADYVLHYKLYDRGGWILDSFDIDNYQIKPLIAVPEESLKEFLSNHGYNDVELVSIDEYNKDATVYKSEWKAFIHHEYMTETQNIVLESQFIDSNWVTAAISNDSFYDWSSIYGTWTGVPNEESKTYFNININSIDINKGTIDYSYEFYEYGKIGEGLQLYSESMTGQLENYDYSLDYDYETEIKIKNDISRVSIYIGKNNGLKVHANNTLDYIMTQQSE